MQNWSTAKKVGLLFILLLFPSLLYIFLITGKHNFAHLAHVTYVDESGIQQNRPAPQFKLVNQNGDTLTNEDLKGKVYVADFFFTTCPSICIDMTQNMKELYGKFGEREDFAMLSISINPDTDSIPVLKDYATERGIDYDNWNFVTGEQDVIFELAYGFLSNAVKDENEPGGYAHSGHFILVDKEGNIRSREDEQGNVIAAYDGTSYAVVKRELMDDIKVLFAEYQLEKKDRSKK